MENLLLWWESFEQSLLASLTAFVEYLPSLGAAVLVMLVGWAAARLIRALLLRSGSALNRALGRFERPVSASRLRVSRRLVALTGNFVFWMTVLVFAAAAARVAGLEAFSVWLDRVVAYLPTLIAGLLIAFAGYLLSSLVRDIVSAALGSVASREAQAAGVAAQGVVFVTALVIGLDQIGIDVTFLITIASVLVAGVLLSIALAFGLGAREFVGNLIAARQLQGALEIGDYARCGDVEGRVLEVTPTMIVLVNDKGRVLVPASHLQSRTSEILSSQVDE
jgi:small-conductance mechanosensitive channel